MADVPRPAEDRALGPVAGGARAAAGGVQPGEARNLTRGTVLCASLEVAESFAGRFMGLMGRPALPPGAGLWLRPASSIHMLFMRFPIDAVFLGRPDPSRAGARPVVSVHLRLRTWTGLVPLVRGAQGVLELPAGTIERSGTVVGDLVTMDPVTDGAD